MQKIRIVDVPEGTTAEATEQLLNAPCDEGYYLDKITGCSAPGMAARAYYRLRAKPEKG